MPRRGFTLLEILIALAILGFALISMVGWLAQSSTFENRLDLHRIAIRELEAQHEILRAGAPLPGFDGSFKLTPITPLGELDAPALTIAIDPQTPAGLYRVTLEIRYRIGSEKYQRSLEALTWRP